MKNLLLVFLLAALPFSLFAQEDSRTQPPKDLNDFFPFEVPESIDAWETRADDLRRRVLVANGLWPMPKKTPLNPVIHGKVERPGFTIEKVYFESYPGLYVSGILFRPTDPPEGKLPAVLSPHGHGGRLQDHGAEGIRKYLVTGGERFEESGRMPKVARCATLARLGCVVFLYDMFGYADSTQLSRQLAHGFAKQRPEFEGKEEWGLFSAQAEMRLQSIFGLQAWNSIRGLDFLESLPDVDPKRIAVTGGSGGGTQTIMLCAIDDRPIAAFPNGMVSSSMQGGCTCENASLLRIGTGNVELAALFAPKPQGMTAANDWTREMLVEGKGFPELKKLYGMYGKEENVLCADLLHFPHNYNYVTRAIMYSWFNKHLGLGHKDPIVEEDFKLITREEQAVWTAEHPEPEGGDQFELNLTRWIADQDQQLLDALSEEERRAIVRGGWQIMIGRDLPSADDIKVDDAGIHLVSQGELVPHIELTPKKESETTVIWLHPDGKAGLADIPGVQSLVKGGTTVLGADLFEQGVSETRTVANKREFAGFTHGYNHSVFAQRTHDVLTLIAYARSTGAKQVHLVGSGKTGPIAAAACAIAGDRVGRVIVDNADFRFADIASYRHPDFIPGAVKYGDLPGLLSLIPKEGTR